MAGLGANHNAEDEFVKRLQDSDRIQAKFGLAKTNIGKPGPFREPAPNGWRLAR
jgi:hypothetical protein